MKRPLFGSQMRGNCSVIADYRESCEGRRGFLIRRLHDSLTDGQAVTGDLGALGVSLSGRQAAAERRDSS